VNEPEEARPVSCIGFDADKRNLHELFQASNALKDAESRDESDEHREKESTSVEGGNSETTELLCKSDKVQQTRGVKRKANNDCDGSEDSVCVKRTKRRFLTTDVAKARGDESKQPLLRRNSF